MQFTDLTNFTVFTDRMNCTNRKSLEPTTISPAKTKKNSSAAHDMRLENRKLFLTDR